MTKLILFFTRNINEGGYILLIFLIEIDGQVIQKKSDYEHIRGKIPYIIFNYSIGPRIQRD